MSRQHLITLRNDFHHTEVRVKPTYDNKGRPSLTPSQWRRVLRTLCGSDSCCCGYVRGSQDPVAQELWDLCPSIPF